MRERASKLSSGLRFTFGSGIFHTENLPPDYRISIVHSPRFVRPSIEPISLSGQTQCRFLSWCNKDVPGFNTSVRATKGNRWDGVFLHSEIRDASSWNRGGGWTNERMDKRTGAEERAIPMVVEIRILRDTEIYRSRDWKAADLWTGRLKRMEDIVLGIQDGDWRYLTWWYWHRCSEGSQNTPWGTGERVRKKMWRDVQRWRKSERKRGRERRVSRSVRARHSNENLTTRFHVEPQLNAIDAVEGDDEVRQKTGIPPANCTFDRCTQDNR